MNDLILFSTFDIATGTILQTLACSDIHGVDAQCDETTDYVFGHWDRTLYVVRDGEAVLRETLPPGETA